MLGWDRDPHTSRLVRIETPQMAEQNQPHLPDPPANTTNETGDENTVQGTHQNHNLNQHAPFYHPNLVIAPRLMLRERFYPDNDIQSCIDFFESDFSEILGEGFNKEQHLSSGDIDSISFSELLDDEDEPIWEKFDLKKIEEEAMVLCTKANDADRIIADTFDTLSEGACKLRQHCSEALLITSSVPVKTMQHSIKARRDNFDLTSEGACKLRMHMKARRIFELHNDHSRIPSSTDNTLTYHWDPGERRTLR